MKLSAHDVAVRRGGVEVLHGLDLALGEGEAVALVGPNAAGKSTLLRALLGLLPLARGEVRLDGRRLETWTPEARARHVALVLSEEGSFDALTVHDRVALGRYPHRGPFLPFRSSDDAAVDSALEAAGIRHLARRALHSLSAGERQLASLARGLAQEPRLLLLDEPGAHLDVGHQLRLFRILDQARARGVGILAVVHDLQRAAAWAQRMVLLAEGRVVLTGTPAELLASPECARVFQVTIRRHDVPGSAQAVYSFEEPR
jgi:iron complex transport system ATP-binding protein